MQISKIDLAIIYWLRKIYPWFSRISLFIVYFWFGILKIFKISPANPLVEKLLNQTMPFIPFSYFIIFFGVYEMFIGILFLIKGAERLVILLLLLHMLTTFLPLFFLPEMTWQKFFVPTLEGQYIIKNLVIISLALVIGAHLKKLP